MQNDPGHFSATVERGAEISDRELSALIHALGSDDRHALHRAGERLKLLAQTQPKVRAALLHTLRKADAAARKGAAFLLGERRADAETVAALAAAVVEDAEPKVRKNAAVSLGRSGAQAAVAALRTALDRETVSWVRPSLILAIGAVGGPAAVAALEATTARDAVESEALRKALDHARASTATSDAPRLAFRPSYTGPLPLLLPTPIGLESVALAEARQRGLAAPTLFSKGLLHCAEGTRPEATEALRCTYGPRIGLGKGPSLPLGERAELRATEQALRSLFEKSPGLAAVREFLTTPSFGDAELRYRFAIETPPGSPPPRRELLRLLLPTVRALCAPHGLIDSPANYDFELRVSPTHDGSLLVLVPSFLRDARFAYRVRDVGASIHPVVAAGLARLVDTGPGAQVLDPTCGSATLLVERAQLDDTSLLHGFDVSPTAVAAAQENLAAAGLAARIAIERSDARHKTSWQPATEVLCNLPFGLRTGRTELDERGLEILYTAVWEQLDAFLSEAGQAVLYTAAERLLLSTFEKQPRRVGIRERLRIASGGLVSSAFVISRPRGRTSQGPAARR